MFEDPFIPRGRRKTGSRNARLLRLLEEDTYESIASEVEKEGHWKFTKVDRVDVLRRVRQSYSERNYPQATFEDWHPLPEGESDEGDNRDLEYNGDDNFDENAAASSIRPNSHADVADFDSFVVGTIVNELKMSGFGDTIDNTKPARAGLSQTTGISSDADSSSEKLSDNGSSGSDSSMGSSSEESSSESSASSDDDSSLQIETNGQVQGNSKAARMHDSDSDEEDEDDSLYPDSVFARKKLKMWASGKDTERSWLKDRFVLYKSGLEFREDLDATPHNTVQRQHTSSLRTILHMKVLEQDWVTAYQTFSLLIKIAYIDVRSLWPLGVEILTQLRDKSRTESSERRYGGRQEQMKIQQFFEWMALAFPMYVKPLVSFNSTQGPVFRTGSRTYTPIYRVAGLWNLLSEKQYSLLRDKLNEIMLVPPYAQDGVFCYMLIVCCLSENKDLASVFFDFDNKLDEILDGVSSIGDLADDMSLLASKESIKTRIFRNIAEVIGLLDKCDSFDFEYSRETIEVLIDGTRSALTEQVLTPGKEKQIKCARSIIPLGYNLKKGKMVSLKHRAFALPKKYWDRSVQNNTCGVSNHWSGRFFVSADRNKVMCLICGKVQKSRHRANLVNHLSTHKITAENQKEELGRLKEADMAEMVKSQNSPVTIYIKSTGQRRLKCKRSSIHDPKVQSQPGSSQTCSKEPVSSSSMAREDILSSQDESHNELANDNTEASSESVEHSNEAAETSAESLESARESNEFALDWMPDRAPASSTQIEDIPQDVQSDNMSVSFDNIPQSPSLSTDYQVEVDRYGMQESDSEEDENHISNNTTLNGDRNANSPINHIEDSFDGRALNRHHKDSIVSFGGFSPDATQENQTFAEDSGRDVSRDISRDFHQFATQTQESQKMLKNSKSFTSESKDSSKHDWRGEFTLDSYPADSSINFTRVISDSFLADSGQASEDAISRKSSILDSLTTSEELKAEKDL